MTDIDQSSIINIINEADVLAPQDMHRAIDLLESAADHSDFAPWGSFRLLEYYERSFRSGSAPTFVDEIFLQERCLRLFEAFPRLDAIWCFIPRLFRFSPKYAKLSCLVAEMMLASNSLSSWLAESICECALSIGSEEAEALLQKAVNAQILSKENVARAMCFSAFLCSVRVEIAKLNQEATSWSIVFGQESVIAQSGLGHVRLNLSALILRDISTDMSVLISPFFWALYGALGWAPFRNDSFREACQTASSKDEHAATFIRSLLLVLTNDVRLSYMSTNIKQKPFAPGELWIRSGCVELWALHNYLLDPVTSLEAAEVVAQGLSTPLGTIKLTDEVKEDPWWPRLNPVCNITRLATNAGWYATPGSASATFRDWAERYQKALCKGNIFDLPSAELLPVIPLMRNVQGKVLYEFDENQFIKLLDGAAVVFATPFFRDVQTNYDNGGVDELWGDLGFCSAIRRLRTLSTPMSVYPYKPDECWSTSFAKLVENCSKVIEEIEADVFISSCGAYGLPLAEEINSRFGIAAIYNGHISNMYFGIYTNDVPRHDWYQRSATGSYWIASDLEKQYPLLGRIDDGRYIGARERV